MTDAVFLALVAAVGLWAVAAYVLPILSGAVFRKETSLVSLPGGGTAYVDHVTINQDREQQSKDIQAMAPFLELRDDMLRLPRCKNCKFSMYHLSEDRSMPVCKRCEAEKAASEEAARPGQHGDGSRWDEL